MRRTRAKDLNDSLATANFLGRQQSDEKEDEEEDDDHDHRKPDEAEEKEDGYSLGPLAAREE